MALHTSNIVPSYPPVMKRNEWMAVTWTFYLPLISWQRRFHLNISDYYGRFRLARLQRLRSETWWRRGLLDKDHVVLRMLTVEFDFWSFSTRYWPDNREWPTKVYSQSDSTDTSIDFVRTEFSPSLQDRCISRHSGMHRSLRWQLDDRHLDIWRHTPNQVRHFWLAIDQRLDRNSTN